MIIELKEIEVKPENKWNAGSYTETGLMVVDDGITQDLIFVPDDGISVPYGIIIPTGFIKRYVAERTEREIADRIFSDISKMLEVNCKKLELLIENKNHNTESISGDVLLKAMALVQNSEIAKEIVNVSNK